MLPGIVMNELAEAAEERAAKSAAGAADSLANGLRYAGTSMATFEMLRRSESAVTKNSWTSAPRGAPPAISKSVTGRACRVREILAAAAGVARIAITATAAPSFAR